VTSPPRSTTPVDRLDQPARQQLADLFGQHQLELVRLAFLLVRDQPTAEDVVQDVFARMHERSVRQHGVHQHGGQAGRPGEELAYIRAAVVNGCRSVLRRRAITSRLGPLVVVPDGRSAEAEVMLAQDRAQVLDALARLPARRREVLVLRYFAGLSYAEIATALGISQSTVRSNAARGIAWLAQALGEQP
jgi:RNA polymerase sigma factor (sigma-70 family)